MLFYIVLGAIGYAAMIYLTLFVLSVTLGEQNDSDHGILGLASVAWPFTLLIVIGTGILFLPVRLAQYLHHTGEAIARSRAQKRDEN